MVQLLLERSSSILHFLLVMAGLVISGGLTEKPLNVCQVLRKAVFFIKLPKGKIPVNLIQAIVAYVQYFFGFVARKHLNQVASKANGRGSKCCVSNVRQP